MAPTAPGTESTGAAYAPGGTTGPQPGGPTVAGPVARFGGGTGDAPVGATGV